MIIDDRNKKETEEKYNNKKQPILITIKLRPQSGPIDFKWIHEICAQCQFWPATW